MPSSRAGSLPAGTVRGEVRGGCQGRVPQGSGPARPGGAMIDPAVARRLKLVGFDVDGVLTDNGIYVGMVGDHPVELKRFHIQDGLGIRMLRDAGLVVVLASARRSEATELRARELKVDEVVQDKRKLPAFEDVLRRRGVSWEDCAFVGDDLPDLPLLRRGGVPIAVANAGGGGAGAGQRVARAPRRQRGGT